MSAKDPKAKSASRTLSTLLRVARALREPTQPAPASADLRDTARRTADGLRRDPRVQNAAQKASELRHLTSARADQRLAALIQEKRAARGQTTPQDVTQLLEQRQQEHQEQLIRARARQALLAQADTPDQHRVLTMIAAATPWAGGQQRTPVRYTELLDHLAPSGNAVTEMAIHRALWTLAERRVLAVSPHGQITAIHTIPERQWELEDGDT